MFDGRFNHFICDGCGTTAVVPKYPNKWIQTRVPDTKHYCLDCQKKSKVPNGLRTYREGEKEK